MVATRRFTAATACSVGDCCAAGAGDDATPWVCAICQEGDTTDSIVIECQHRFHAKCILEHVRRGDPRCPLCRDDPYAETYLSDEDDEDTPQPVPFREALQRAKENTSDPTVQRMKETLKKWKKERSNTKKEMRTDRKALKELEKAMDDKIDLFARKLQLEFDKKNTRLISKAEASRAAYQTACTNYFGSQTRLAKKHGWFRVRYSAYRVRH